MHYKVAIIGAGMAGLGAARTFYRNGMNDFVVIEAGHKPGGRIDTIKLGTSVIELGAQWLHGENCTLHSVAVEHGLIHDKTSDEGQGLFLRDDGRVVDDWLVKVIDFKIGRILEECEEFVGAEEYPESVGDYLEGRFSEYVKEDEVDAEQAWELYDWHVRFQLIDNSCADLRKLSAREWGSYCALGKDGQAHINLKGGYGALVNAIIKDLPSKQILLNSEVTKITSSNNVINIKLSTGTVITADYVIVTVSIGVLQANKTLLHNIPLPLTVATAINSFGYDSIGKIFLQFEEKWWKSDGFQLIWRRSAKPPKHIGEWTRHLTGFDPVLDQPNVLVGWLGEPGVQEMEQLDDHTAGKHCTYLLRMFLSNEEIPYPIKVYKSSWGSNKWIMGGYSHATPKCDEAQVNSSSLLEPVVIDGVSKVLFCGEAANRGHFSTTHGAFESGEQQASVLLNEMRVICKK